MKLAIVGGGPAGLEVLRQALKENLECTVFEQSGKIGGIWNYTLHTDKDEHGLPVHSAVYEEMTTNLPKETMEFEDFSYQIDSEDSFISHIEVLKYIKEFSDHFNLIQHVQFLKKVIMIKPIETNNWEISIEDVNNGEITKHIFNAVALCTGHFFDPFIPKIPGQDVYKGEILHSRCYRKPDPYKNKKVLIIGGGPSGIGISTILVSHAKSVHLSGKPMRDLEKTVVSKPRIKCFTESKVLFEDNIEEEYDDILYCTGYNTIYPFLSPECEIQIVEQKYVKYLYKHLVNIEHPTMAFITITEGVTVFPLLGLQARFFLAILTSKLIKTKEEMYKDLQEETAEWSKKGLPLKNRHILGPDGMKKYCDDLASTAGIRNISQVVVDIYRHYASTGFNMVNYKIIDKTFIYDDNN